MIDNRFDGLMSGLAEDDPVVRNTSLSRRAMFREPSAVEQTLDAVPSPVSVVRRDGTVEYANAPAKALHTRGLVRVLSGRVSGVAQISATSLQNLLDAAASGATQEVGLWLAGPGHLSTATLHLSRLAPESPIAGQWPRAALLMLVTADDAARVRAARLDALAWRYRFTAAEMLVLKRLANGESTEAVANAQGVQVTTVRTHIRHLLEKTYTKRLVDLLRMVGS